MGLAALVGVCRCGANIGGPEAWAHCPLGVGRLGRLARGWGRGATPARAGVPVVTGGLFLHVPSGTVENRQLTLDLQTENKGSIVSGGELTVFLDGPAVALGSVPDGSAGSEGECEPESVSVSLSVSARLAQGAEWGELRCPGPTPTSTPREAPAQPGPAPWAPAGVATGSQQPPQQPGRSGPSAALLQPSTQISPFPCWISPFPACCEGWGNGVSVC